MLWALGTVIGLHFTALLLTGMLLLVFRMITPTHFEIRVSSSQPLVVSPVPLSAATDTLVRLFQPKQQNDWQGYPCGFFTLLMMSSLMSATVIDWYNRFNRFTLAIIDTNGIQKTSPLGYVVTAWVLLRVNYRKSMNGCYNNHRLDRSRLLVLPLLLSKIKNKWEERIWVHKN
jgi:hypothetical protein